MKKDLLGHLEEYCSKDYIPLHMPGAKRNIERFKMKNPYEIDITEIDGFDNMHHAETVLKEAFIRTAKLFGADESLWLINGSSAGLLAAICGTTFKGDTVLVARNCHRAVYNAVYLNELNPIYIYPKEAGFGIYGEVSPKQIEDYLKCNEKIKAVIITSPTYEGIVSDIKKIGEIVHRYGKILIVDEAHGAHFTFNEAFPKSALSEGADIVIQSIHKTLPSLTQTALLHLQGKRISKERVIRYWDMYQTTSPSYVLMGGIDRCMTILETDGKGMFDEYVKRLKWLRKEISKLKYIKLFTTDDISKIVLIVKDGKELYQELLEKYHIQLEMASLNYVIAMTSIGDTQEYYDRFLKALQKLDNKKYEPEHTMSFMECRPLLKKKPFDAMNEEAELTALKESEGKISAVSVCFYPPGIPLVNPGEVFTKEVIAIIEAGIEKSLEVIGIEKKERGVYVLCLK